MAYADGSDLVAYYDINTVGDLVTDDRSGLSRIDIVADDNLTKALSAASGEINVCLQAGGFYSLADLALVSGDALEHLKRITCDIAMAILVRRRLSKIGQELAKGILDLAEKHLDNLRKGINIFGLPGQAEDSLPTINGPTVLGYETLNLMPDRMVRHFATRAQRLPLNRG